MDLGLRGLRAIVTGGTKGIGRAIADTLAGEGCDVGICARNAAEVKDAVGMLEAKGVTATGAAVDVADGPALKAWVAAAAGALGGLDIIVTNVSALAVGKDEASWQRCFEVDMMHTVRAVDAAMPYLEKSRHGAILVVSSVSGIEIDFAAGSYGAMKAALINYTSGLSTQLAPKGIRANAISPGNTYFDGGIWQKIERDMPDLFKASLALNPTGRMASAQEIANGAVFLVSPAASFVTGANLVVDGALTRRVQY